jgi:outer membrane protein assembly factor BamB
MAFRLRLKLSPGSMNMKLSVSQALCEAPDIFQHWEVTPEVIVFLLTTPSLQARNWEGELLWQVDVAEDEPWGLSVGGGFVFVGAESGAVMEFDLASGYVNIRFSFPPKQKKFEVNLEHGFISPWESSLI